MHSVNLNLLDAPPVAVRKATWTNPVVPGDHPDPTIIRIGRTYWASCTSGEWSPQFPLFRSTDLIHWQPCGSIFPRQPAWATGDFWAPELVHDEVTDRCLVWYVARNREGLLAIAVATAPTPAGPWTDHGPILAQPDGSIDPCFARDEHGEPFLIWKEDGNSQGTSTPIWAQPLSEDLLHLTGEKTMLITNDQPWEGGLVEAPFILRHEGRFFMFYAGNTCCGRKCNYAEGIARADRLLGPWEKFAGNPLIAGNQKWRCPGHGTAVRTLGTGRGEGGKPKEYLIYHAYPAGGNVYVGREAVLDEITWPAPDQSRPGAEGWPQVNAGMGPGEAAPPRAVDLVDGFRSPVLGLHWQWPVNTQPEVETGKGRLRLGIPAVTTLSDRPVESAMVATPRPASLHYRASVGLAMPGVAEPELWVGLAVVGDPFNTIGLGLRGMAADAGPSGSRDGAHAGGHVLSLWERRGEHGAILWQTPIPAAASDTVWLRSATVGGEHCLQFSYSLDGLTWSDAGEPYDPSELPAWDHGLRIALMLEGARGLSASFTRFELCAT